MPEYMRYENYESRRESSRREYRDLFESRHSIPGDKFEREIGMSIDSFSGLRLKKDGLGEDFLKQIDTRVETPEAYWNQEHRTLVVAPPQGTTTARIEDLPKMAIPVVTFMKRVKPDIVVGCDRGGRMYSLAVRGMQRRTKKSYDQDKDGSMHFARLSKSLDPKVIRASIQEIVESSLLEARKQGKRVDEGKLKFMFIDDWVTSGTTRDMIIRALKDIGLSTFGFYFVVMCGHGADATGSTRSFYPKWQNDTKLIGVYYNDQGEPFPIRTKEAIRVRKKLYKAANALAKARK